MCVIRIIMTQSNVSSILPQVAPFSHPSVFPWKSQNQNPHSSHPTTIESLYVCVIVEKKKNKKKCVRLSVFVIVKQRRRRELHGERKTKYTHKKKETVQRNKKQQQREPQKLISSIPFPAFMLCYTQDDANAEGELSYFLPHTNTYTHTHYTLNRKHEKKYLLAVKNDTKKHTNLSVFLLSPFDLRRNS